MSVIKIIATLFIFSSGFIDQSATLYLKEKLNVTRVTKKGDRKLKLFFRKTFSESFFSKSNYDLIPAFKLTANMNDVKISQSLIYHLEPDNKHSSHYAIMFINEDYNGVVNFISDTFISRPYDSLGGGDDVFVSTFETDVNNKYFKAWAIMNKPNVEFVFSVIGFNNFWWFVKHNKLFILDIETMRVINENEFRTIYKLLASDYFHKRPPQ